MESTWLASSNLEIPAADWACTPPSVQRAFAHVLERVAALEADVSGLREENARRQEQTRRSSHNSSQPPSSDAPRTPTRP
jgi:hypothetical protein